MPNDVKKSKGILFTGWEHLGRAKCPQRKVPIPAAAEEAPQSRRVGVHGYPSIQIQCQETLKFPSIMVTIGVVNFVARNFHTPHFCVFFCDSGRFLDSKIPVNYHFVTPVSLAMP
jgi:hypothetical protein